MNYEHRKKLGSLPSGVQIHFIKRSTLLCADLTLAMAILAGSSSFLLSSGFAAATTITDATTTTATVTAAAHLCADLIC